MRYARSAKHVWETLASSRRGLSPGIEYMGQLTPLRDAGVLLTCSVSRTELGQRFHAPNNATRATLQGHLLAFVGRAAALMACSFTGRLDVLDIQCPQYSVPAVLRTSSTPYQQAPLRDPQQRSSLPFPIEAPAAVAGAAVGLAALVRFQAPAPEFAHAAATHDTAHPPPNPVPRINCRDPPPRFSW